MFWIKIYFAIYVLSVIQQLNWRNLCLAHFEILISEQPFCFCFVFQVTCSECCSCWHHLNSLLCKYIFSLNVMYHGLHSWAKLYKINSNTVSLSCFACVSYLNINSHCRVSKLSKTTQSNLKVTTKLHKRTNVNIDQIIQLSDKHLCFMSRRAQVQILA
jgi:hypothetical protein